MNPFVTLSLAALMLASAPVALAADGTAINVTGSITAGTCTVNSPNVTLQPLKADLVKQGQEHWLTDAPLDFTGCIGVNAVTLSFSGTPHDNDDNVYKNLDQSDMQGVGIVLIDKNAAPAAKYLKNGSTRNVTITNGTGNLPVQTAYYRGAGFPAVMPATISTAVTVDLDYN